MKCSEKGVKAYSSEGKVSELLEKDPGQTVKQLAEQLSVNRTFLARYLKALENQSYVRSKKIGPAKVISTKNVLMHWHA